MPVEGIKVSTLINKVQQSNLTTREKYKLSNIIEFVAKEDGDITVLNKNEQNSLIKLIDDFSADPKKIKNILGLSSGETSKTTEKINKQNNPDKLQDIHKSGAKWQTVETRYFGGNVTKTIASWERLEDGTSIKTMYSMAVLGKGFTNVMLKSHYQSDDKTPIQTQSIKRLGGVNFVVDENYNNDGSIKNRVFKLDDYNKNKRSGNRNMESLLLKLMPKVKNFAIVIKDSSGQEKIRCQNASYSVNGQSISPENAKPILKSISNGSGYIMIQEF